MKRPRGILPAARPALPGLAASAGLLLAVLVAIAACGREPRALPPVRNAVVICLDTVRFDTFALAARSGPFRPWAERALRFSRVQAPAPWTLPSVASTLTGLWPRQHGAGRFLGEVADLSTMVPTAAGPGIRTLPQRLRAAGIRTAALTAHPLFDGPLGLERGFAELSVLERDQDVAAAARIWLDRRRDRRDDGRFFLYLHFLEAHDRHMVPAEEIDARLAEVPPRLRALAAAAAPARICTQLRDEYCRRFQLYVAAVASLQERVAGLLDGLARRGMLDHTAVLLYSDHGEEFLEHWGAGAQRAADPRGFYGFGHGHTLYQEVLHVPVLAWHPAAAGREVRAPASLVDVAPTLADWLGVGVPAGTFAGVSLARSHHPGFDTRLPDRPLFSSGIAFGPRQTAVVERGWKRIVQRRPEARVLFHLADDPGEKQPVSEPRQERRLDREIARYRNLHEPPATAGRLGDEQIARLQALGYLTAVTP